jgi:hypothetical protein
MNVSIDTKSNLRWGRLIQSLVLSHHSSVTEEAAYSIGIKWNNDQAVLGMKKRKVGVSSKKANQQLTKFGLQKPF